MKISTRLIKGGTDIRDDASGSHYGKMAEGWILQVCFMGLCASMLLSCGRAVNYLEPVRPRYSGTFAGKFPLYNEILTVVSFNIKFSDKINRAELELNTYEPLKDADIVLLQEMDNEGARQIADALRYNYVYYPANIHPHHDKDFGNAILTKWPIMLDKKVILPFEDSRTKTRRIAVAAVIAAGECEVLVYSTHLATFWSGEEKSMLQADAILKNIPQHYPYIIIGGDFNTITRGRFENLENKFRHHGYILATEGISKTVKAWPFNFQTDHIFSKGFQTIDAGKAEKSVASDHFPIWVKLKRE